MVTTRRSSIAFQPAAASGGLLTVEEYESRRDVCTEAEVGRLKDSKEFKDWEADRRRASRHRAFRGLPLAGATLLLLTLCALALSGGGLDLDLLSSLKPGSSVPLGDKVATDAGLQDAPLPIPATPSTVPPTASPPSIVTPATPPTAAPSQAAKRTAANVSAVLLRKVALLEEGAVRAAAGHEAALRALRGELERERALAAQRADALARLQLAAAVARENVAAQDEIAQARLAGLPNASSPSAAAARAGAGAAGLIAAPSPAEAASRPPAAAQACAPCEKDGARQEGEDRGGPSGAVSGWAAALAALAAVLAAGSLGYGAGRAASATVVHVVDDEGAGEEGAAADAVLPPPARASNAPLLEEASSLRSRLASAQAELAELERAARLAASGAETERATLLSRVAQLQGALDAWRCAAGQVAAEAEAAAAAAYVVTGGGGSAPGSPVRTPLGRRTLNRAESAAATPGTPMVTPATARFKSWLASSPDPVPSGPADEDPAPWLAGVAARVTALKERALAASRGAADAAAEARSLRTDLAWHGARVADLTTDLELAREQLSEERRERGAAREAAVAARAAAASLEHALASAREGAAARGARVEALERELACLEAQVEQLTAGLTHARGQKAGLEAELAAARRGASHLELLLDAAEGEKEALGEALGEARAEAARLVAAGQALVKAESAIGAAHRAADDEAEWGLGRDGGEVGDVACADAGADTSMCTPPPHRGAAQAGFEEDLRRAVHEKVAALEMLASAEKRMLLSEERGEAGWDRGAGSASGGGAASGGGGAGSSGGGGGRGDGALPPRAASPAPSAASLARTTSSLARTTSSTAAGRAGGGVAGYFSSKLGHVARLLGGGSSGGEGVGGEAERDPDSRGGGGDAPGAAGTPSAWPAPGPLPGSGVPAPEALAAWLARTQALFGDAERALGGDVELDAAHGGEEVLPAGGDGGAAERRDVPDAGAAPGAAPLGRGTLGPFLGPAGTPGAATPRGDPAAALLDDALKESGAEVEAMLARLAALSCGAGEDAAHALRAAYVAARRAAADLARAGGVDGEGGEAGRPDAVPDECGLRGAVAEARAGLDAALARKAEAEAEVDRLTEEVEAAHAAFDAVMAAKLAESTGSEGGQGGGTPADFKRQASRRSAALSELDAALAGKRGALNAVAAAAGELEGAERALAQGLGAGGDAGGRAAERASARASAALRLQAAQNGLAEAVGDALGVLRGAEAEGGRGGEAGDARGGEAGDARGAWDRSPARLGRLDAEALALAADDPGAGEAVAAMLDEGWWRE
ncbi:hypothetical protein ACKKBG_A00520 [Auxenochlorella protothecoides x Auxenochlorella symbiontica]